MANSQTNFKQVRPVATYNPPVRNVGVIIGNKVETFQERQYLANDYNPSTDSYYANTAFTASKPHVKRIFNDEPSTKYPLSKIYKRFHHWFPINGDDYFSGRDTANVWVNKQSKKYRNMITKPTKAITERQNKAHEIEYFRSKYNHATTFYFLACLFYIMTVLAPFIMLFGVIVLGYFVGLYSTWSGFFQSLVVVAGWVGASYILWQLFAWLGRHTPDNKSFKLNRRTGMACFPQKGKQPDKEIPFAEFEPRISTGSTPGGFYHQLVYVHHTGSSIFGCGERFMVDVYLKMAYLEQFMDITKPLPDMPCLEWCRDKDPTTSAYDKANNRPTNYWRDMNGKQIRDRADTRRKELYKMMGPDMFAV